jgi:multicomponent Na+:H+ antiporter subunit D
VLYMVGAFSISGVPLFNGFVSKSMIVSAAAEGGRPVLELLLTLASVGTFLHTGLKLPWFTFFAAPSGLAPRPIPRNMLAAMAVAAALCTGLGLFPSWLYARLPFGAAYEPYTLDHVVSALQLLLGTGAAFVLLRGSLGGEPTVSLDTDWLYRRPLRRLVASAVSFAGAAGRILDGAGVSAAAAAAALGRDPLRVLGGPGRRAEFDPDLRRMPIGATVLWIVAALGLTAILVGR